jgi:hypothetical protein
MGGCELWRSTDGDNWVPMTRNGFNNRFNLGVRTLISTPRGLFVGTANPFGSHVAVRGPGGWRYEENPRGGVEVWLGSTNHSPVRSASATETISASASSRASTESVAKPSKDYWRHEYPSVYRLEERARVAQRTTADPFLSLAMAPNDLVGLAESVLDETNTYFGGRLRNVGYWRDAHSSPYGACRDLVHELLELAPEEILERKSLSVAAYGSDPATLEDLARIHFPVSVVHGDESAALPRLAAATCDLLLAIEAAPELDAATIANIARGLRPAGVALLAHGIRKVDGVGEATTDLAARIEALRTEFVAAGFATARIEDITAKSWAPFFNHSRSYLFSKLLFKQLDAETHRAIAEALPGGKLGMHGYVLICAVKL